MVVRRYSPPKCRTADLFGEPALPTGFQYMADVISPAEEHRLVQIFEQLPMSSFEFHGHFGNRRIYTFGHRYVFAGQLPRANSEIPAYVRPLTQIASRISGIAAEAFEQVMITDYPPGAGIGWHRDRPTYGDIAAISFLTPCVLRLRRRVGETWERRSAWIEPRSCYLLHGDVRNRWQHSIAPMDVQRYSMTLRTFRPGHGAKDNQQTDRAMM
jgi:hypothetical protein